MEPKITMKKFVGHLRTACTHRFWVGYYCFKAGIPWQGLTHDLSKFSPVEFWEGVRYYTGTHSPIDDCKKANGYSMAWFHHRGRNKHHYEYWCDNFDRGGTMALMPYKYTLEMLCDYLGAGRAYNGKNFTYGDEFEWFKKVVGVRKMHPVQKLFILDVLEEMSEENRFLSKKELKELFDSETSWWFQTYGNAVVVPIAEIYYFGLRGKEK